ncbi:MAG TPA: NAD(P)/FAD-dependent oxidoreductase [Gammaproteobacteria bacterium]|nr:NAD(P)/FAD-dependent oxidoreductase [Gammaproteobacteria bacterium]
MRIKITRRDLLNGIAIGTGGLILQAYGSEPNGNPASVATGFKSSAAPPYYPPTLTGMRGSHDGSYEVAHALAWQGQKPKSYEALDEHYDLVVVGGGMSGLAATWYYRKKIGPEARILILDNHDDFGGHAKRNEFHYKDRMVLSLGGAQNLDNPGNYSEAAGSLMIDIGIDQEAIDTMEANTPDNFTLGGKLNADVGLTVPGKDQHLTLGGHWLKFFHGRGDYRTAVAALPIADDQKEKLISFFGGEQDLLDDLSLTEKWNYVNSVSYNQFLFDRVGLSKKTIPILNAHLLILNGPSGWNHTVREAIMSGCPGLRAMGWLADFVDSIGAMLMDDMAGEIRMFPDGNASVARLLVQKLIPGVAPDMKGFEDVAVARFDYGALDQEDQPVRIRLNSTAVGVKEVGDQVQVDYVQHGKPLRITARHCVLACYNNLIPHLCPEMSDAQKDGLRYGVRVPFVYANVLLDNGRAFSKLGVTITQCPYDPFQWVSAAPTMTSGGYEPPRGPDDPMVVFMMGSPTPSAGEKGTTRDLLRIGRHKIYATTFEQYEKEIREQLQGMLGNYGLNHETDIKAITVNRIPHGYAYWYQGLHDPEWEEGKAPHEIGRQKFGRISIANSDSEVTPLMNAAFDAAWRAVEEQTA